MNYPDVLNPVNSIVELSNLISLDAPNPAIKYLSVYRFPSKNEDTGSSLYKNVVFIGTFLILETLFINSLQIPTSMTTITPSPRTRNFHLKTNLSYLVYLDFFFF